jgi:hypothetical protein
MPEEAVIRDYTEHDFLVIKEIHDANGIDYRLPDLNKFPVNKVLEIDGKVKAAYGMQMTLECHLWMDRSRWLGAYEKWLVIKSLDREANEAAAGLGFDSVFSCVPPGYERFGKRLKDLGFAPIREGWKIFTKQAGDYKCT